MKQYPQIITILVVALSCQSCGIIGPMLFNPSVKSAFIVPNEVTPIEAIKSRPGDFSGSYIAVNGVATSVNEGEVTVDGYLLIRHKEHPYFKKINVGDRVAARGKFSDHKIGGHGPELRFPTGDQYRDFHGANLDRRATALPSPAL